MPYIVQTARTYFDEHPGEAKEGGDVTYCVYKAIYKMWKAEPRFKTFFELTRGQRNLALIPKPAQDVMKRLIGGGADPASVFAAYDCSVQELWTRHVAEYEKQKMLENGDVETQDAAEVKA